MLENIGGNAFLVISVLVFIAVLLLLEGGYLLWKSYKGPDAQKIETRIRAISASLDNSQSTQLLKRRMLADVPFLERLLLGGTRVHNLDRLIQQSGLGWSVSRLLLSCLALGALATISTVYVAHQSLLLSSVVGAMLAVVPLVYLSHKRGQRLQKFEAQLPDALDLITRALRSGHAFSSALQMVGDEMTEPVAGEFRIVHDEVNFGVALQQALTNLSVRVPSTDLRYFIVSVLIQRESGGNLTEVLTNLSKLIRERLKLMSKIRVLSAEGRLSAWVLGIMPFALAGAMVLANPEFMKPLWNDPMGISIIKYMLILMAFGVLILRKIIKIRV